MSKRKMATSDRHLLDEIGSILQDATPEKLVPGTMDVDKLAAAIEAMREGLTEDELEKIVRAMNEEYIEPEGINKSVSGR